MSSPRAKLSRRLLIPAVLLGSLAVLTAVVMALAFLRPFDGPTASQSSATAHGVATPTPTPQRKPPAAGEVVAFIGDSYVQAAGAENPRWSTMLSNDRQWKEDNVGLGGTTYNRFSDQIPEAAAENPVAVIVCGGRNDGELRADDIRTFYKELRQAFPHASLYAMEPLGDYQPRPAWLVQKGAVVKQAVESVGGVYLAIGQPLYQHPEWVQDDHVHPNEAGHRAIADAVDKAIGH